MKENNIIILIELKGNKQELEYSNNIVDQQKIYSFIQNIKVSKSIELIENNKDEILLLVDDELKVRFKNLTNNILLKLLNQKISDFLKNSIIMRINDFTFTSNNNSVGIRIENEKNRNSMVCVCRIDENLELTPFSKTLIDFILTKKFDYRNISFNYFQSSKGVSVYCDLCYMDFDNKISYYVIDRIKEKDKETDAFLFEGGKRL